MFGADAIFSAIQLLCLNGIKSLIFVTSLVNLPTLLEGCGNVVGGAQQVVVKPGIFSILSLIRVNGCTC